MREPAAVPVSAAFRDLYDFGREQGPVPGLVLFWHETFARERRLLLRGPVGGRVEAVLEALTGAAVEEDRLRRRICEARPDAGPGLEGIDVLAGRPFAGALVSAALHGAAGAAPESMKLADWLERVALVVVVSPAPAVLGKLEIELMERLAGEGRGFCVLVTRLEGASEEERAELRAEIAEHKVEPLRGELGPFEVFYAAVAGERDPALREGLEAWVRSRLDETHLGQLHRVVARWAAGLQEDLETRAATERRTAARLDFLTGHLEDQIERLRDLVSQERMAVENRVLEAVRGVEEVCGEAPATGDPGRVRTAWDGLAARLAAAPSDLVARVRERFAGQIREFCAAYRDLLPPFEFDEQAELGPGEEQPRCPPRDMTDPREVEKRARSEARARLEELAGKSGRRLEAEAEAVLRKLDRHVRAHLGNKRASLQAAGLLSRLAELAAAWDRAVAEGRPSPGPP